MVRSWQLTSKRQKKFLGGFEIIKIRLEVRSPLILKFGAEDQLFCQKAVLRIRNKSFGSGFGSGSGLKIVSDPDSNSDPNPGFGSRSETDQNFFFFVLK
jgi:hypothetical protein